MRFIFHLFCSEYNFFLLFFCCFIPNVLLAFFISASILFYWRHFFDGMQLNECLLSCQNETPKWNTTMNCLKEANNWTFEMIHFTCALSYRQVNSLLFFFSFILRNRLDLAVQPSKTEIPENCTEFQMKKYRHSYWNVHLLGNNFMSTKNFSKLIWDQTHYTYFSLILFLPFLVCTRDAAWEDFTRFGRWYCIHHVRSFRGSRSIGHQLDNRQRSSATTFRNVHVGYGILRYG